MYGEESNSRMNVGPFGRVSDLLVEWLLMRLFIYYFKSDISSNSSNVPQGTIVNQMLFTASTSQLNKSMTFCSIYMLLVDKQLCLLFFSSAVCDICTKINTQLQSILEVSHLVWVQQNLLICQLSCKTDDFSTDKIWIF